MQTVQNTTSITATQSITLVKNLFRASFSSIAYVRNLFSDEYFAPGKIGDTKYRKIIQGEDKEVKLFVDWLEHGVFDALQKRYLEVVLLEIYEATPAGESRKLSKNCDLDASRKLLECFSFSVSYSGDGASFALASEDARGDTSKPIEPKAQIKQNTSDVVRLLIELSSTLRPLPPNRVISVKLMYTSNTPIEYEPPLFRKARAEEIAWFSEKPTRVSTGTVTTPFHHISMSIRSTQGRAEQDKHIKIAKAGHLKTGKATGLNPKRKESTIPESNNLDHPGEPRAHAATVLSEHDARRHTGHHQKKKLAAKMSARNATNTVSKSGIKAISKGAVKASRTIVKPSRSTRTKKNSAVHSKTKPHSDAAGFGTTKSAVVSSEPSSRKPTARRKSQRIKADQERATIAPVSIGTESTSTIPPPKQDEMSVWTLSKRPRKTSEVEEPVVQIRD